MVMLGLYDSDDEDAQDLEPASQKYTFRKPVCPYVCSTPCDFVEERTYLAEEIFPKLHEICLQRGTAFSPVDNQWTPDSLQTDSGHLLRVNLDLITKCCPFFVCLLGETYGPHRDPEGEKLPQNLNSLSEDAHWLEKNFLVAASAGYKWIQKDVHQNASIPELEIFQAAFLSADNRHCHFYYRQPEHLDHKTVGLSDEEVEDLYKLHKPDSEYADLNIRDLKQRIVNKGLPVKYFQTKEQLGAHVLEDWTEIIDMLYPPLLNGLVHCEEEDYREWLYHEVFSESRRHTFINHSDLRTIHTELTDFCSTVLDEPMFEMEEVAPKYRSYSISSVLRKQPETEGVKKTICVLKGDKGTGKSALVANWVRKFTNEYPEVKVISHYVGSSGHSWDVTSFMRRCVIQLREHFLKHDHIVGSRHEVMGLSFKELSSSFQAAMSLGPCVLLLDGVDELGASKGLSPQEIKAFSWIPTSLQSQCKVILTTSTSDYSHSKLLQRPDVKFICLSNMNTTKIKAEYLEDYMGMHFNHLSRWHLQSVFESKLSGRPLFLKLAAMEMTSFSIYRDLNSYTEIIRDMCTSTRDLYVRSIRRWCQDYSWTYEVVAADQTDKNTNDFIGWVPDVLRLLAVSRSGLSANEMLEILEDMGYQENVQVTTFDWLMFRVGLAENVTESPYGIFNFAHQHLKEVVEYVLLRTVKASTAEIMSKSDVEKEWKKQKNEFHNVLIDYFRQLPHSQRRTEQLPWQLLMAGDLNGLRETVADPVMFLSLYDVEDKNPSNYSDLSLYWFYLTTEGHSMVDTYMQLLQKLEVIDRTPAQQFEVESVYGSMSDVFGSSESRSETGQIPQPPQIMLYAPTSPSVPKIYTTPASNPKLSVIEEASDILSKDGRSVTDEAIEGQESVFITQGQVVDTKYDLPASQVTMVTWYIAQFLLQQGQTSAAETVLLALNTRILKSYPLSEQDQLTLAKVEECLGQLYMDVCQTDHSEKWYKKSLRTIMDMVEVDEESDNYQELQELKGKVIQQLGTLRLWEGLLDMADDLLEEARDITEVTGSLPPYATVLFHIGNLRLKQQDYLMAETNLRKCLMLRHKWYGKSHPLVADVYFSLGLLMSDLDNDKGYDRMTAEDAFRKCLEIREHHLDKSHVLVANVLFELGKLLKNETSYAGKAECQRLLRRALDIRITQLGGDHIETRAVRQYLNNLEAKLKSAKVDSRSSERPYSSLSWRGNDLANLERKSRLQSGKSSTINPSSRPGSTLSRTGSHFSRPNSQAYSMAQGSQLELNSGMISQKTSLSFIPASERVMMETSKPRLLHRESVERKLKGKTSPSPGSPHLSPHITETSPDSRTMISVDMHVEHGEFTDDAGVLLDSFGAETEKVGVKFKASPRSASFQGKEDPPGRETPPQRLYRRYGSPQGMEVAVNGSGESQLGRVGDSLYGRMGDSYVLVKKDSQLKSKRPAGSARSVGSSHYTTASGTSVTSTKSHKSACDIPHGPHSIHISNARTTTMGPHSSLKSLLGEKGRRDISKSIHHKSAWYHVPGRYSTAKQYYPPKRSQTTKSAKDLKKTISPTAPDPYANFMKSDYRKNNPNNYHAHVSMLKNAHSCSKGQLSVPYPRTKPHVLCEQCHMEASQFMAAQEEEMNDYDGGDGGNGLEPMVSGLTVPDRPRQVSYMLEERIIPEEDDFMYTPPSGPVVKFNDAVVMNG